MWYPVLALFSPFRRCGGGYTHTTDREKHRLERGTNQAKQVSERQQPSETQGEHASHLSSQWRLFSGVYSKQCWDLYIHLRSGTPVLVQQYSYCLVSYTGTYDENTSFCFLFWWGTSFLLVPLSIVYLTSSVGWRRTDCGRMGIYPPRPPACPTKPAGLLVWADCLER